VKAFILFLWCWRDVLHGWRRARAYHGWKVYGEPFIIDNSRYRDEDGYGRMNDFAIGDGILIFGCRIVQTVAKKERDA
jgi:hypothetical protein